MVDRIGFGCSYWYFVEDIHIVVVCLKVVDCMVVLGLDMDFVYGRRQILWLKVCCFLGLDSTFYATVYISNSEHFKIEISS